MKKIDIGREFKTISNLVVRKLLSNSIEKGCPIIANPTADKKKITPLQGMIIGFISDNSEKDVYQKDLEKQFLIRRSTATEVLKLMEQNGLILKESVPNDARLKKIVLTQKAVDLHDTFEKNAKEVEYLITKGFQTEELEVLMKMLGKIKKNLE